MKFSVITTIKFATTAFVFYQIGAWDLNSHVLFTLLVAGAISILTQHTTSIWFPQDVKAKAMESDPASDWKLKSLLTQLSRNQF